jgi:hypothetical protein
MSCEQEKKERRASPFPVAMQGSWIGKDEPEFGIYIEGLEIVWHKMPFEYIDKLEEVYEDGVVVIQVLVPYRTDSGDDINLVAWPEGEIHAFNDHFAINLVRAKPDGRPCAQA